MATLLRLLAPVAFATLIWAVATYTTVVNALVVLAAAIGWLAISIYEELADIQRALEMQSRKLFPELWEDE